MPDVITLDPVLELGCRVSYAPPAALGTVIHVQCVTIVTLCPSCFSRSPRAMYGCTSPLDPIVRQTKCRGVKRDTAWNGLFATKGMWLSASSGNVRLAKTVSLGGTRISAACLNTGVEAAAVLSGVGESTRGPYGSTGVVGVEPRPEDSASLSRALQIAWTRAMTCDKRSCIRRRRITYIVTRGLGPELELEVVLAVHLECHAVEAGPDTGARVCSLDICTRKAILP